MEDILAPLFERNFEQAGEVGASISVWRDGEEIVSLHRGWRDREHTRPWTEDTLAPVWSITKGPAAIATLLALHDAGLSPDAHVTDLWPELTAAKEARLRFADILSHRAGLPVLDAGNRPSILSYREVIAALEKQPAAWEPRRSHGYHPRTYGFLLDEIVRRASGGTPLGHFWRERIADPLRIDFRIGNLSADDFDRLATIIPPRVQRPSPEEMPFFQAFTDSESIAARAFSSPAGMKTMGDINRVEYLQAGLPSLGGVGSARGVARFYQLLALGGELDGVRILPKTICLEAGRLRVSGVDETFRIPTAFGAGFMKDPVDESGAKLRSHFGPSDRAFGQPGAGGSHAFADPEHRLSFAYVMNQMETGILPNRKSLDLVDAIYRRIGAET